MRFTSKNSYIMSSVTLVLASLSLFTMEDSVHAWGTIYDDAAPKQVLPTVEFWPPVIDIQIIDESGKAISDVSVAFNGTQYQTDEKGRLRIPGNLNSALMIKKAGYRKLILGPQNHLSTITLQKQEISGVYVQAGVFKNKNSPIMKNILDLLESTELNALVIDVKDDNGSVVPDMKSLVDEMHEKGIYMIARVVAFKDHLAANQHPEMALTTKEGKVWRDKKGGAYLNPFDPQAQNYVLTVAKFAIDQGFDEIEFDYVRFPTDGDRRSIAWSEEFTADTRTRAIAGFLKKAQEILGGMGAFIAADVFGDTADVPITSDSGIGQRIKDITPYLDYVCPMVYPSGYAAGTDGLAIPVDHPGELVQKEIYKYRLRADKDTVIRPWLQAFRDYAFNRRSFGDREIHAQIQGSSASGGVGFLLWNAGSRYTGAGLKTKIWPYRWMYP